MNYSIKEHKGKSARVVQVQDEEGGIIEHTMQEEVVENAIWKKFMASGFIWQNRHRSSRVDYKVSLVMLYGRHRICRRSA